MYLSNLQNAYCRSQISFSQRHKNTILYLMWYFIFIFFFLFCEKQIMRVDKVRLSWFILLNSYSLKKEKEKKWSYTFKKKRKVKYKHICVWTRLSWFFLYIKLTHTFSKTEAKKVVIYFQEEKKRTEKWIML